MIVILSCEFFLFQLDLNFFSLVLFSKRLLKYICHFEMIDKKKFEFHLKKRTHVLLEILLCLVERLTNSF